MNASDENLLDDLLSAASEELEKLNKNVLQETDIFKNESNLCTKDLVPNLPSNIHNGDTDSSEDEGRRNFENVKYSDYGKDIKHLLQHKSASSGYDKHKSSSWKTKALFAPAKEPTQITSQKIATFEKSKSDVYMDPIFGLRIINPLISSTVLKERMEGREAVFFSRISRFLQIHAKEKDWVIAGVIAHKSATKTSQKGSEFCIWTLTDLKDDIKTVSLFLFSNAFKQLWKTAVGTVVGVLNPNVLDKKDGSKDEATLSIDNSQKVMIFGQSKDFGTCKSTKKNGENCTAIVNINKCEYCVYHIRQEYQKCSKRSELQANFAGRGLTALRNKVLGKNEVFYAGKSYTAIPAKKNKKMEQKDNNRLMGLSKGGVTVISGSAVKAKNKNTSVKKQNAARLDVPKAQRLRDMELLKKLGGTNGTELKNSFSGAHCTQATLEASKNNAINIINRLKEKQDRPSLSKNNYVLDDGLIIEADKTIFRGKLSATITSDESEAISLGVIPKLKSKTRPRINSNGSKRYVEELITNSSTHGFDNDIDLDYDMDLNLPFTDKSVTQCPNVQNGKSQIHTCDKNVLQSDKNTATTAAEEVVTCHEKNQTAVVSDRCKQKKINLRESIGCPVLSASESSNMIDLNMPITSKHKDRAKLNAIKVIQKNGPIKKVDPNSVRGSGRKRPIEEADICGKESKKSKLATSEFISDRFKKMMTATSKHLDLLEARDDEEKDKYFFKMEKKEQMEEKMANTFKVACKAVKCLTCKYTSFSAADMCKSEKHPLKVFDAMKRFFKCGNCGNRIVSLDIVPTGLCKNCGSGRWEKTGMMKEKVATLTHSLSIRGGEQKFINSHVADANINLLMPDD